MDATEQEIPRPKNKLKRKTHYSGKKKRHTVKTQLTVNKKNLIIQKTAHVKGSMHDYTLYKYSHPHLPGKVCVDLDLGYLGIRADYIRNFQIQLIRARFRTGMLLIAIF